MAESFVPISSLMLFFIENKAHVHTTHVLFTLVTCPDPTLCLFWVDDICPAWLNAGTKAVSVGCWVT